MERRKILCLHGAGLSSMIFKLQLVPYISRLEEEQNVTFHFVDAPITTEPHESIVAFSDEGYRFFHWAPSRTPFNMKQIYSGYDFLHKVIEEQGPFDGVIGFSQGAAMSMGLLMHHAELHQGDPTYSPFRFAILFACPDLPPNDEDGSVIKWGKIQVPSLHILGQGDEDWFKGGLSVYENNCEDGSAKLIVHNGGHIVPKDKATVDKVITGIKDLLSLI